MRKLAAVVSVCTLMLVPSPALQDYTQYRSTSHQHTSAEHNFTHSGTNGFTSTMSVSGKR
jgi:hypothetical protein